jgi:hypothetical protein
LTKFIFALYNVKDDHYTEAKNKVTLLEQLNILIPWPCLYECVNTKFVKKSHVIVEFEQFLKKPQVKLINDKDYRELVFSKTFEFARAGKRHISLTDMVVRLMLEDINLNVNYLFTFNYPDFCDICCKRRIEIA